MRGGDEDLERIYNASLGAMEALDLHKMLPPAPKPNQACPDSPWVITITGPSQSTNK